MAMKRRRSVLCQDVTTSSSKKRRCNQSSDSDNSQLAQEHPDLPAGSSGSSSSDEVDSQANVMENLQRRIQTAVKRYDKIDPVEMDIRDTLRQLSYQQSQELAKSLVHWGRKGGLREKRQASRPSVTDGPESSANVNHPDSTQKIYDPTANSFTLWPLPVCPKPDWTLEEELSSLVSVARRKYNDDDEGNVSDDLESETSSPKTIISRNRALLQRLFHDSYQLHPPSSSSFPVFTTRRRERRRHKPTTSKPPVADGNTPDEMHESTTTDPNNQPAKSDQTSPLTNPKDTAEFNYGLDWRFILRVADTNTKIKKSVLQRTCDRLLEMFRISPESSHNTTHHSGGRGDQPGSQASYLSHLNLPYNFQRHRIMDSTQSHTSSEDT